MEQTSDTYIDFFRKIVDWSKEWPNLEENEIRPGLIMSLAEDFRDEWIAERNAHPDVVALIPSDDVRSSLRTVLANTRNIPLDCVSDAVAAVENVWYDAGLIQSAKIVERSFFGEKEVDALAIANPADGFPEEFDLETARTVNLSYTFSEVLDIIKAMPHTSSADGHYFAKDNDLIWLFLEYLVLKDYLGKNETPMWSYEEGPTLCWDRVDPWIMYHKLFQNKLGWKPSEISSEIITRWNQLVNELVERQTFRSLTDTATGDTYLVLGPYFYRRLSSLRSQLQESEFITVDDLDDDRQDNDPENEE